MSASAGACRVVGQHRSTQRRELVLAGDDQLLRAALREIAAERPRWGYRRAHARLIELGFQARDEVPLVMLASPWLDELSARTGDTIHLAIRDGDEVLYLHKTPGRNGPEMRSRVGHRMPLARTGIGKALMLDAEAAEWVHLDDVEALVMPELITVKATMKVTKCTPKALCV